MAKFNKIQVIEAMRATGMVPVFFNKDLDVCKNVIKACYEGGVRVFEFTNRGDFAHEIFGELVKWADKECPELILGAGTVIDAPTAALYIQLGANFIVGPNFVPEIAPVCNRRLVHYSPGCGSVTEISNAQAAGCDVTKVFPAGNVGGPSFVKNVLAAALVEHHGHWCRIAHKENLSAWIKAGVLCGGYGSQLLPQGSDCRSQLEGQQRQVCRGSWLYQGGTRLNASPHLTGHGPELQSRSQFQGLVRGLFLSLLLLFIHCGCVRTYLGMSIVCIPSFQPVEVSTKSRLTS
jgi:2-dehydro-3-deoxyphosphogluconate aldolase/(4S)-4-hydroxy-2-oxoglutarate aldolase